MLLRLLVVVIVSWFVSFPVHAGSDAGRWRLRIEPDVSGYRVEMREGWGYDPGKRWRGGVDEYGNVRLRRGDGAVMRGRVDEFGRGRLRDVNGKAYEVRPRGW